MRNSSIYNDFIDKIKKANLNCESFSLYTGPQSTNMPYEREIMSNKLDVQGFSIFGKNHNEKTLEIAKNLDLTNASSDCNTLIYFYETSKFQCTVLFVTNTGDIPAWLASVNPIKKITIPQIIDEASKRDYLKDIVEKLSPKIMDLTSNHNGKELVENMLRDLTSKHYDNDMQQNSNNDNFNLINLRSQFDTSRASYRPRVTSRQAYPFDLTTPNTKESSLDDLPEPIKQYISSFL